MVCVYGRVVRRKIMRCKRAASVKTAHKTKKRTTSHLYLKRPQEGVRYGVDCGCAAKRTRLATGMTRSGMECYQELGQSAHGVLSSMCRSNNTAVLVLPRSREADLAPIFTRCKLMPLLLRQLTLVSCLFLLGFDALANAAREDGQHAANRHQDRAPPADTCQHAPRPASSSAR